jgi:hypothetical protein
MNDRVEYKQIHEIPGLMLGDAHFTDFSFDRHFHLDYHVGLVTDGVQRQHFSGKTVLLGPGCISMMPPGEIHDGVGEAETGYTLKKFRLSQDLVSTIAVEITESVRKFEWSGLMIRDPALAEHLVRLHHAMQRTDDAGGLEVQIQWLSLFEWLLGGRTSQSLRLRGVVFRRRR